MTTRKEIISHIDDELIRLERARDYLAAALKGSPNGLKITLPSRVKAKVQAPKRRQPAATMAPAANGFEAEVIAAPAPAPQKEEPQVQRVPPRRRMERRNLHAERSGKSAAALSGSVPTGPVAVSAVEARKVQERVVQPPASAPVVSELRTENGERSLGSLIQAFERRAGVSGLETT